MKKLVFTLLAAFAIANTAISQHLQIHETNEGYCRQNYHSVLTPEGDIILDEDLFDCDNNDIGIKFLKYNREGSLIDSLFVDDIQIFLPNLFERNPFSTNESVYTYVSKDDNNNMNYFNAMFLSDDMEITNRVRTQLPMEGNLANMRFHMEEGGNILMSWYNASEDTCHYARMNMTGEVLAVSEPLALDTLLPMLDPWFKISDEPYRVGFMMFGYNPPNPDDFDGIIYINIIDEGLNVLETKKIERIGGKQLFTNWTASAVEMGDGCFLIMGDIMKQYASNDRRKGVAKYNANFEQLSYHMIKNVASWMLPQPMSVDKINGGVYVVWNEKDVGIPFKTHVRYLNSNLEEVWDRVCIKNAAHDINTVLTSRPLENGGAVLTGYMGMGNYWDSYVFLDIIDSDYDSTNGQLCNENPFVCYPNPSNGVVNLSFAENTGCQSVDIYAIDGRLLKSQGSDFERVDMSGLESGIYIIKVRMADGREFAERIVKE